MKKTILRVVLGLLVVLLFQVSGISQLFLSTAQAVGDFTVDWGVPVGSPIFDLAHFSPGDSQTRVVTLTNNATTNRQVALRSFKTDEIGKLGDALFIVISDDTTDLYGGLHGIKTLNTFFQEGASSDGILLTSLAPSAQKKLTFKVTFGPQSGNQFQNSAIKFTLQLGVGSSIPVLCQGRTFNHPPIYGTQKNDRLQGTNGNDLILALEGNDQVDGKGGDDCIIGGPGNDEIQGGPGDDSIDADEGNDIVRGGSGRDTINGYAGDDQLFGQSENDILYGGIGNDLIEGGTGSDSLYGNEGDDYLQAGSGDDQLLGGEGRDTLNGSSGRDRCSGELKSNCEE